MRILITGVTGFVGLYLARYCAGLPNVKIYGTSSQNNLYKTKNAESRVNILECDLTKKTAVAKIIKEIKPDKIFHLAAKSFVPFSFKFPKETLWNNIVSELHILEAVKKEHIAPVIIIAGSSEEYGWIKNDELPIKETNQLRPVSPYGVSKVAQEMLGFQYYKAYNLNIIPLRFFNIEGPGKSEKFAASSFAKQIAIIEKGRKTPTIEVGNLESKRDFLDVRDAVEAYWKASEKCKPGEPYNVCSGRPQSVKELLDMLLNISPTHITIKQDQKRMRASDTPIVFGDNARFKNQTGWEPTIPLKKTMEDLLNYWRVHV